MEHAGSDSVVALFAQLAAEKMCSWSTGRARCLQWPSRNKLSKVEALQPPEQGSTPVCFVTSDYL